MSAVAELRQGRESARNPAWALIVLVLLALAVAALSRLAGAPSEEPPPRERTADYSLTFRDRPDGAVVVASQAAGVEPRVLPAGTHNFVRGVVRGLARERRRRGIGDEVPFLLSAWDDGALTLADPATGRRVELGAFGSTNLREFRQLLPESGRR
jgi:putative photosynthetic complex assembly protein